MNPFNGIERKLSSQNNINENSNMNPFNGIERPGVREPEQLIEIRNPFNGIERNPSMFDC